MNMLLHTVPQMRAILRQTKSNNRRRVGASNGGGSRPSAAASPPTPAKRKPLIIDLQSDITAALADHVCRQIKSAKGRNITIRINSRGGSCLAAMDIIHSIEESPSITRARISGVALSGAAMVAIACDRTIMTAGSTMLVHEPRITDPEDLFDDKAVEEEAWLTNNMYDWILARCADGYEALFKSLIEGEEYLDANQCFELGLVDRITPATGSEPKIEEFEPLCFGHTNIKKSAKQRRGDYLTGNGEYAGAPCYSVRINGVNSRTLVVTNDINEAFDVRDEVMSTMTAGGGSFPPAVYSGKERIG